MENPCIGPWAQVPPSGPKEQWRNGANPEPAAGMAGADAQGALGNAGAMERAELMTGFIVPYSICALGQLASCMWATWADSNTQ